MSRHGSISLGPMGEVFPSQLPVAAAGTPRGLPGWEHLNDRLALFIIATSPRGTRYLRSLCQEQGEVYKACAL